jgi:hypothetical protein
MGKHEVLRDTRLRTWDDMSTGPVCELFHTLVIFRACYCAALLFSNNEETLDLAERAGG